MTLSYTANESKITELLDLEAVLTATHNEAIAKLNAIENNGATDIKHFTKVSNARAVADEIGEKLQSTRNFAVQERLYANQQVKSAKVIINGVVEHLYQSETNYGGVGNSRVDVEVLGNGTIQHTSGLNVFHCEVASKIQLMLLELADWKDVKESLEHESRCEYPDLGRVAFFQHLAEDIEGARKTLVEVLDNLDWVDLEDVLEQALHQFDLEVPDKSKNIVGQLDNITAVKHETTDNPWRDAVEQANKPADIVDLGTATTERYGL